MHSPLKVNSDQERWPAVAGMRGTPWVGMAAATRDANCPEPPGSARLAASRGEPPAPFAELEVIRANAAVQLDELQLAVGVRLEEYLLQVAAHGVVGHL